MADVGRSGTGSRAEHWQSLISAWSDSGLSQRAFCARRGIRPGTFAWWRHRLSAASSRARRRSKRTRFVPVDVRTVESVTGAPLEILLPDGITLRLGSEKYQSWKAFLDEAYWSVELR